MKRSLVFATGLLSAGWMIFVVALGIRYDMFWPVVIGGTKILAVGLVVFVPIVLMVTSFLSRLFSNHALSNEPAASSDQPGFSDKKDRE
jgi:hypothetical protein